MTHAVVPISDVRPDPNQPRKYFKRSAINALARSIELVGQLTPISVRRLPLGEKHKFEIIDGERRWRACSIANRTTIKVDVEEADLDERQRHLLSTISNFHREGHTHAEISDALQYQRQRGESVASLAENLAKSEPWVYQYLSLQRLAPEFRDLLSPDLPKRDQLRFGEAVVLASLTIEQQIDLWNVCRRLDRVERISVMRKRAAEFQGKERLGRPKRRAEHRVNLDRAVGALCRQIDAVLELKQSEFEMMLLSAEPEQLDGMSERLNKLRSDIGIMAVAVERATVKLKAA
jgi:ParB family chromosome partitioning protein